jgi:hypothetical protein
MHRKTEARIQSFAIAALLVAGCFFNATYCPVTSDVRTPAPPKGAAWEPAR